MHLFAMGSVSMVNTKYLCYATVYTLDVHMLGGFYHHCLSIAVLFDSTFPHMECFGQKKVSESDLGARDQPSQTWMSCTNSGFSSSNSGSMNSFCFIFSPLLAFLSFAFNCQLQLFYPIRSTYMSTNCWSELWDNWINCMHFYRLNCILDLYCWPFKAIFLFVFLSYFFFAIIFVIIVFHIPCTSFFTKVPIQNDLFLFRFSFGFRYELRVRLAYIFVMNPK